MILIGTAGYHYKDWRGVFYPERLPEREWLPFYARHFPFTEVNATFYRLPHPAMLRQMAAKVPPEFRFVVKAYRGLTHEREQALDSLPPFREALRPLVETGQLAGVLLQFPFAFRPTPASRDYLRWLRQGLGDLPLVVEFRHRAWVEDERTFELLAEEGMGYACVDEPPLRDLVPPVLRVTAPPAYVRLHGRNARRWWRHDDPAERYDYLYSEPELREWVPRLRELERQAGTVFVSFNNHRHGQAVLNGRMLRALLEAEGGAR